MKIAFVYDRVNKWGGAERVLLALHELWPEAPLFTAVYDRVRARWADVFEVRPSFLQHVPFTTTHHELFAWATPFAFESFVFDEFDVIISITSAEAKDIITKPGTIHICYCLTPTRYLWSGALDYQTYPSASLLESISQKALRKFAPTLRTWDIYASTRPDAYLAISQRVKKRIEKYYHRPVTRIIYPPVQGDFFTSPISGAKGSYYLLVSRLVGYKRVDIVVEAFNKLGLPLVIIGDGRMGNYLREMAHANITFVKNYLTDKELVLYYQNCRAFVYGADEDFGIVVAEAQALGKPVIAYEGSGAAEIVISGKTGELYKTQTVEALVQAIKKSEQTNYIAKDCRDNVRRFHIDQFKKDMNDTILSFYHLQTL